MKDQESMWRIKRVSDGLYYVSNWRSHTRMGRAFRTRGAAKNAWNAHVADRSYFGKPDAHILVRSMLTDVETLPLE